jgi:hypothetical protein
MSKIYKLTVSWGESGTMYVEAESKEEAIRKACDDLPLPDGTYLEDSFQVDYVDDGASENADKNYVMQQLREYVKQDCRDYGVKATRNKLENCGISDKDLPLLGIDDMFT